MEHNQSLQFWSILGSDLLPENQNIAKKPKFLQKPHPQEYQIMEVPGPRKITEFL